MLRAKTVQFSEYRRTSAHNNINIRVGITIDLTSVTEVKYLWYNGVLE